jgi:cobalt-zinc-cadmium efflux system membrane fusion protein
LSHGERPFAAPFSPGTQRIFSLRVLVRSEPISIHMFKSIFIVRVSIILLILAVSGFAQDDPTRKDRTVILHESAVKNLRIETVEAEEKTFEETLFALGRLRVAPGHRAIVSSRVPGRVITVAAHIDTPIEKGAEAVVIESRQPGDPPPSVRLVSPISGFISAVKIVPGQPVEPADSLIEVIDLKELHGVAAVPQHLAGSLKLEQAARIRVPAYPGRDFSAKLEHLGAEADAESGTIAATFHVENPELLLRSQMSAEFSIVLSQREGVMSIPREAVQGDAGGRFVYIADYELKNAFVKTPVVLGTQNDRYVEVKEGLFPGDEVVTRGAYSLAFAGKGSVSLKEAMDAAHGHPHNEDGSEIAGTEHEHEHDAHAPTKSPLTAFLIATNALLLVLLIFSLAFRRKATPC